MIHFQNFVYGLIADAAYNQAWDVNEAHPMASWDSPAGKAIDQWTELFAWCATRMTWPDD